MEPRALCDAEIDAVAGGSLPALFGSNNTINFLSGNGGISGPAISINILGVNQYSSATSGSANGPPAGPVQSSIPAASLVCSAGSSIDIALGTPSGAPSR
ncbi:hypothetical protein ACU4GR_02020 [Methylobacterium oryzae CBMB20]